MTAVVQATKRHNAQISWKHKLPCCSSLTNIGFAWAIEAAYPLQLRACVDGLMHLYWVRSMMWSRLVTNSPRRLIAGPRVRDGRSSVALPFGMIIEAGTKLWRVVFPTQPERRCIDWSRTVATWESNHRGLATLVRGAHPLELNVRPKPDSSLRARTRTQASFLSCQ